MRRFVIIGQKATASDDFLLDDLPGTSGRLDVLLRCIRAALLFSNGLRRNVVVYLVLLGGPRAPRVLRADAAATRLSRPDERSLATLIRKALASRADTSASGFVEVKPGISISSGGLQQAIADLGDATPYLLEEGARDVREFERSVPTPRHSSSAIISDSIRQPARKSWRSGPTHLGRSIEPSRRRRHRDRFERAHRRAGSPRES